VDLPQRLARQQERRSAEFYGARLTPASGSRDAKGDAETADELFEFKHTERLSYGLKMSSWLRHRTAAILAGKRPVMEVEYTRPDGSHPEYVVVLDRDDYLAMRDELVTFRAEVGRMQFGAF
jgi:hypothetical protein